LLASISAADLRRLADVNPRKSVPGMPGSGELGIQRNLQKGRAEEIARYVRGGYPMSTLTGARLKHATDSLKKPGWLASSIIVNVLQPGPQHDGRLLHSDDALVVAPDTDDPTGQTYLMTYPTGWDNAWEPLARAPIEVIDGQHRLWAFSGDEAFDNYEVPVVIFLNLDIAWQAYLFWTVNIKPKRISPSLAYDLYPLLREQEWLEAGEGLGIYRETRAQEITEALFSNRKSAWFGRINMLGDPSRDFSPVTQAAFVRSLTVSYIRPWKVAGKPGGLFGGSETGEGLRWNRLQQAATVTELWDLLNAQIESKRANATGSGTATFLSADGQPSLLATDQGVRCVNQVTNDLLRRRALEDGLPVWAYDFSEESFDSEHIESASQTLREQTFYPIFESMMATIAGFDWRTSKASNLSDSEKDTKSAYRGSGGYSRLRRHVLEYVAASSSEVAATAEEILDAELDE
jgi:DGQHR domain-containing protein